MGERGADGGSQWGLSSVPSNFVMVYLVLSVLSTVTHLRTFSVFRTVQLRERMSGVSVAASFLASNLTDLGWILLSPAVFFAIYYFVALPRGSFGYFYLIGVLVCWWSSGLSYVISISTIPPQAQLICTVILSLILGAFLHGMSPTIRSSRGTLLEVVLGASYNRWAMEAATIGEFKHYYEYKSNEIIMIYYGIGLCNMDRTLIDDADKVQVASVLRTAPSTMTAKEVQRRAAWPGHHA
ncbi:ABC transporter G family member 24 [Tetrabaena socialis]|uniref:ABC transporter G family member 24 n=1 Tax=Tetrabaena socialis TaxID=47790 RepID=A0A2J7ZZ16_9CHLO|nr:ABC transporter G family member 24 [Tetrabaena socialis]|eukprot:PNH05488.1 ABC transporter G family member 24 [Tetrabaena socialis]